MDQEGVNIVVVGLSGQGIIMFSKVLTSVFARSEYRITTYEVLGTAHRGTLVFSHIRINKNPYFSNLIPAGAADIVVGVEPLEALRAGSYYLADNGYAIFNTHKIIPVYASIGRDFTSKVPRPLGYPNLEYIVQFFQEIGAKTMSLDATGMAMQAGHFTATNMVLLGAMMGTGRIPTTLDAIKQAVERLVPPGTGEMNLQALDMGYEYCLRTSSSVA